MASIRRTFRQILDARRAAHMAGVRFCDGCAQVTEPMTGSSAYRRSQDAALALRGMLT
ncbi:hypothetical protein ACH4TC_13220 [Streptomyces spororaveus]|uniref:hypothetical protein n=1 Tax=Streptomyces spororaveus TaxID=284039 RepID=UPI00378C90C3